MQEQQKSRMRLGLIVIIALGVLTAVEFWAAVGLDTRANAVLVVMVLAKTWLILDYFMHFTRLWR